MADAAAIFGAAAATVAAGLSGVGLYVSGRREERRWRREGLLEGYQRLVELSFERSLLAVRGMRIRAGLDEGELAEILQLEDAAHTEFDSMQTRMRLLAIASVVDALVDLHTRDNVLVELALSSAEPAVADDLVAFERERGLNREAKEQLLRAARASLGVRGASPIDERTWGASSTP